MSGDRACRVEFPSPLSVQELAHADGSLYFALRWDDRKDNTTEPSVVPSVSVQMDGYQRASVQVTGAVVAKSEGPSWIEVPFNHLPDGDLIFTIKVFDTVRTIPLRKTGAAMSYLPDEQRQGYRRERGAWVNRRTGKTFDLITIDEPMDDIRVEVK
jgi:hypothetical protein